nr:PREDICTED: nose resistant to fluoxetine protein 6-like [Tribolium castaneum]|eukprot:XP_015840143.1 PREDICTED: nose resistant to fluoxetine protein 6-like [Tribolium castaneum]
MLSTVGIFVIFLRIFPSSAEMKNISVECSKQFDLYYNGLLKMEQWALQMFDAKAKFPTGVLAGNFYDLGNFDECLGVKNGELTGKYCLGKIPITGKNISLGITKGGQAKIISDQIYRYSAFCVPNECSTEDLTILHKLYIFDNNYCYTRNNSQMAPGTTATIAILGIFLLLCFLSTCYDVYLYYKKYKPGNELTIAFSYFTNGKKLMATTKNKDQLLCLNGMKALTMMWIVTAHEHVNGAMAPIANYFAISEFIKDTANMFVVGSSVSVDTFFLIGGLVIVYTFLKYEAKGKKFNMVLFYVHRYIRLTPALGVIILVYATTLKYLGSGPLWNSFDEHLVIPCRKRWWAALLYIQNYVHDDQICVPHSWYLSIDMQLFVLSPLVLLPLRRKPKWTLIGLVILIIISIVIPFGVAYNKQFTGFMVGGKSDTENYIFFYYEQTYGRFGPYVIGMILGYFIFKIKSGEIKIKLKKVMILLLWSLCLASGLACVYAGHDTMVAPYNRWSHSLYIAFNRPAWALAISGIIFLCVSGYGGPVNNFLSASIFQFLSKISYSLYLVHYAFIILRAASYKTEIMLEQFYTFFNFWGDFMCSVGLAVALYLTFESPMIVIEKLLTEKLIDSSSRIPSGVAMGFRSCFRRLSNSSNCIFAIIGLITITSTTYDVFVQYKKKNVVHPIATAFSFYTNGKKLFRLGNAQELPCLNGIKALSMLWVVLGHVYMAYVFVPLDNYLDVYNWLDSTYSQYITGATVSVDTFLVIGGFLTMYTFEATLNKGTKFNVTLYYLHRFLRLTPSLAAMLLAHAALFNYFGSGPLWENTDLYLSKACKEYWWSTLLYIQNYNNPNGICIPQSWYLSVDMQLFLVSPLLLILMRQWPVWGFITTSVLSILSIISSFLIGWFFELNGQMTGNISGNLSDYMKYYYMPTHTRMTPYLMGLMLGYAISKLKTTGKKIKIHKMLVLLAWVFSLVLMAVCLYAGHTLQFTEYDRLANSFYIALMRPTWSFAVCWVIFGCVMGLGDPINKFLSLPIFQILSRLSYSIYLVHYSFIFMTNFTTRSPLHFSDYYAFHKFWGDLTFSLAIAIVWTLIFESPIIVLEKMLFKKPVKISHDKKELFV